MNAPIESTAQRNAAITCHRQRRIFREFLKKRFVLFIIPGNAAQVLAVSLANVRQLSCALAILISPMAHAQWFAICETGSTDDLQRSIDGHNEHVERLNRKFKHYWYFQGTVDAAQFKLKYQEVLGFLNMLSNRRAGVLFYAYDQRDSRLCTWLLSPHTNPVVLSQVQHIEATTLGMLQSTIADGLGIARMPSNRAPRGLKPESEDVHQATTAADALPAASALLLPARITDAMRSAHIDTLVIVPMTVLYGTEIHEYDEKQTILSEAHATSIGTLPFAALPVGDKRLVDIASVVIAPGFFAFKLPPRPGRHVFTSPVIAGDPSRTADPDWEFPRLPGAADEARELARRFGAKVLTDESVSISAIREAIGPDTGLIHLATHGIADSDNPLDGSFLWLNGRWSAREISTLRLESHPLVVMSACQTGLGKDFAVGTIGLARAWLQAGASSVVMSLWNVDDRATRDLMTNFVNLATDEPVDKALQRAMQQTRAANPNPYFWAGFTVFGVPELRVVRPQ